MADVALLGVCVRQWGAGSVGRAGGDGGQGEAVWGTTQACSITRSAASAANRFDRAVEERRTDHEGWCDFCGIAPRCKVRSSGASSLSASALALSAASASSSALRGVMAACVGLEATDTKECRERGELTDLKA